MRGLAGLALACGTPGSAPPDAPPADVTLAVTGVTETYRAAFAAEIPALARELGGRVPGPVTVDVAYAGGAGTVVAAGPWGADLVPIGQALARYRNRVAVAADRRLALFRVGLATADGCVAWLEGQVPPDGTTFRRVCPTP